MSRRRPVAPIRVLTAGQPREILEGLRPRRAAIERKDSPAARPRAISSGCVNDRQRPDASISNAVMSALASRSKLWPGSTDSEPGAGLETDESVQRRAQGIRPNCRRPPMEPVAGQPVNNDRYRGRDGGLVLHIAREGTGPRLDSGPGAREPTGGWVRSPTTPGSAGLARFCQPPAFAESHLVRSTGYVGCGGGSRCVVWEPDGGERAQGHDGRTREDGRAQAGVVAGRGERSTVRPEHRDEDGHP